MAGKLFPIGGPVTEEDIVDRETFITTLEMRLADGQSIVLVGLKFYTAVQIIIAIIMLKGV